MSANYCRAIAAVLLASACCSAPSLAARVFLDGQGPGQEAPSAPTLFDPVVIGDFNNETQQGWTASDDFSGGPVDFFFFQEGVDSYSLGNDSSTAISGQTSNPFIELNLASSTLSNVPGSFELGILPGQFDVISFSLLFDTLPAGITNGAPGSQQIVGEQSFGGGGVPGARTVFYHNRAADAAVTANDQLFRFGTEPGEIGDRDSHNIVIHYLPGDEGYGSVFDSVRIDPIGDHPISAGTLLLIDNIVLGRSLDIDAFPPQSGPGSTLGDVNRDSSVDTADIDLMNMFLNDTPGAVDRQNALLGVGYRPHEALETLNLSDFDLSGDSIFDSIDVAVLQSVIDFNGGATVVDWDRNGVQNGLDYLLWQRLDGSPGTLATWQSTYGGVPPLLSPLSNVVPEPGVPILCWLACVVAAPASRNLFASEQPGG